MKILAFDIGGTEIKYALCDESFNLSEKKSIPTNAHLGGESIIDKVIEIIKTFDGIDRIGISTAGQVNSVTGEIVFATDTIPDYTGMKIKEIIKKETGISVAVENDVNSAAIGEWQFGAAMGHDNFLCLTYGTGVGGAIFINGELFHGSSFSAGEFGHIVTHRGGKDCTCGGKGCYETYASTLALTKAVKEITDKDLNGKEIFENFDDVQIKSAIDGWIDEIITGLKGLIYFFNPSLIVLGGGIMNEEYIINEINKGLQNQLMASFRNVKAVRAVMGNSAGLLGASFLASQLK